MKQVGFATRLLAVVAVLSLAAFAVAGCGGKDSNSSSSSNGSSGGGTASGAKQYDSGETVGSAKKVVVDSGADMNAEQQAVINRIGEFADATAGHNYKTLCNDLLSKSARKIGGDCVKTFSQTGAQIKDFKITVKSVKVAPDGKTATAQVQVVSTGSNPPQSQTLSLIKENGKWRIQILGQ